MRRVSVYLAIIAILGAISIASGGRLVMMAHDSETTNESTCLLRSDDHIRLIKFRVHHESLNAEVSASVENCEVLEGKEENTLVIACGVNKALSPEEWDALLQIFLN